MLGGQKMRIKKLEAIKGTHFYGNKVSEHGLKNGRVDYRTLSKSFDMVMNNDILSTTAEIGYWELINGNDYYEDETGEHYVEVYQCFIISERGAEILQKYTDEIIYYNEALSMYVWGVTHFGTSWNYVLTDIKIEAAE